MKYLILTLILVLSIMIIGCKSDIETNTPLVSTNTFNIAYPSDFEIDIQTNNSLSVKKGNNYMFFFDLISFTKNKSDAPTLEVARMLYLFKSKEAISQMAQNPFLEEKKEFMEMELDSEEELVQITLGNYNFTPLKFTSKRGVTIYIMITLCDYTLVILELHTTESKKYESIFLETVKTLECVENS